MTKAGGMTNISKITFPWSEWFHCSLLTVQPHWRCYRCIWHCYRASKINFQSTYINLFKSLLDPPQVTGQHSRSPLEFSKFDVHGTQSISQLKIFGNDSFFTIKNFDYLLFAGFNEITPLCNLSVLTSFCQQIECKTSHFPSSSTVHIIHSMFQHFNFHLLFNCFLKSNGLQQNGNVNSHFTSPVFGNWDHSKCWGSPDDMYTISQSCCWNSTIRHLTVHSHTYIISNILSNPSM